MSENNFSDLITPSDMTAYAEVTAVKKAQHNRKNLFILAILGGVYISIGGMFATMIASGSMGILPYGLVKTLMGIAFSLGLILVVVGGAELFTGSTLVSVAWINGKINAFKLLKNWGMVYLGNFAGSLAVVAVMFWTKQYTFSNGVVGKTIFSIAGSKLHYGFGQALALGIMCNVLVCLAIWLSFNGRNTVDKILAIVFPITAFIALSFEHSVANMYLIPIALVINHFDKAFVIAQGIDVSNISVANFLLHNLLPVTIGNIIGGTAVWMAYWKVYSKNKKEEQNA